MSEVKKSKKKPAADGGLSAQVQRKEWREKVKRAGKCLACGQPKGKSPYSGVCLKCAEKKRVAQRKKRGNKSHAQSGLGRPPLVTSA